MRKLILLSLLFFTIPVWPSIAGCGSADRIYYPKENILSHFVYDFGTNTEPNIPGVTLAANIFNLPSWVKVTGVEYVTATQIAARCNIPINKIKVIVPPDCNNAVLITTLGDPNTMIYKRVSFDVNAPAGSAGKYIGELRVMGENTITAAITIQVNKSQVLFFVGDCNQI